MFTFDVRRGDQFVSELGEVGVEKAVFAHAPDAAVRVQHRLQQRRPGPAQRDEQWK